VGGVFTGFAILLALVALGFVAARRQVLPPHSHEVLARVVFTFASPALLFTTLLDAPVERVLSRLLVGIAASSVLTALVFVAVAWSWRRSVGEMTVGALASSYVNGANLGIPIAFYVLGDAAYVAPVLLFQLVVMAPIALAILDLAEARTQRGAGVPTQDGGRRTGALDRWTRPLRNPIIAASALGLAANLLDLELPPWVIEPIGLLAGAAVPLALLAYGMSLPGLRSNGGALTRDVVLSTGLKVAVHPLIAYGVGRLLGLGDVELFALTVLAALPTAQNIYVYAVRYRESRALASTTVLLTTVLALPAIVVVTAALGV
jgi:malonate transporter and related proteins